MADAVCHSSKPQKLAPDQDPANNPSKFFSHFLYKAAFVTVFLVLLPLFPSLAPEFINQTLHARSWELLQLIFVGIAVSYGLFSKKNDETDQKDHNVSKLDNTQSYVSKLLQVSSVFDDESEDQTVIEKNKVETMNSQYYRGEPVVHVVAKENPSVKEENYVTSSQVLTQKPLLLPVRSLKQRVPEPNESDLGNESGEGNGSVDRSSLSSSSKIFTNNSRKSRNADIVGMLNVPKYEEKNLEENVVLRSPIPWRSRSGRMEKKEEYDDEKEEQGLNRLDQSRSFKSSLKPNSSISKNSLSPSPPPHKLSPSTSSIHSDGDDVTWRRNIPASPPPAPPPPPPFLRKSVLTKSNSSIPNNAEAKKVLRRSVRSVPAEELSESSGGEMQNIDGLAKSVRTYRSPSSSELDYEPKLVEKRGYVDKKGKIIPNEATKRTYVKPENEMVEKVMMESSDEDSEAEIEEDDYFEKNSGNINNGEAADHGVSEVGPDVDKKADEFIRKFREQIRLQRIESIRRSTTGQSGGKTFRKN